MNKQIVTLVIASALILSFSGCDKKADKNHNITTSASISQTTVDSSETTSTITETGTAETTSIASEETTVSETTSEEATTVTIVTESTTVSETTTETTTEATTTTAATTTEATTTTVITTTTKPVITTTATTTSAPESTYEQKLSNSNASKQAQKLFEYICDTYGNGIISGQQESTWMGSDQYEFDYIYKNTGKYPAIRGLDYMNDDFSGVNKRAIDWYNKGGIVTICWHCGSDFSGSWTECMNTDISDWNKALTEGTAEYNKLIQGMDKAAKALQELDNKDIPVLWRPFHELDGGWFWWSKGGAENFQKLWTIMYDRYTNYWKLDNLIWVFGYSGNGKNYADWYPGDEYVDIIGADSYTDGANGNLYNAVDKVAPDGMPICFHECGRIPTVSQLKSANTDWVWFMTWHTEHITDHNSTSDLNSIYNDDYVITLDELPSFK